MTDEDSQLQKDVEAEAEKLLYEMHLSATADECQYPAERYL